MQLFRERRPRWHGKECEEAVDLLWRLHNELAVPLHDFSGLIQIPQHWPGTHRRNRMCLEQKRSDHPEVSATPADSPEEVGILVRAGGDKPSIRQDDIGRQKVIDGQAILSCEVPHAAAQSKATHTCCRNDSRWHGEAEGVRSVVHVTPGASAAYTDGSCRGVDVNVLDARQINDETIITNSQPSGVMASASDRYQQVILPGEMNGGDDIRDVSAQSDEPRFAADHRVIHFACFVVTGSVGSISSPRSWLLN